MATRYCDFCEETHTCSGLDKDDPRDSRISELERALVRAAIPLEALKMAGVTAPVLLEEIKSAVVIIREALKGKEGKHDS